MLEAIAKIDRTPVDLNPVLEAVTKLRKEACHAPVLAAIAQLDHSDTVVTQVTDALEEIRFALEFKPVLERMGTLEGQLNKLQVSYSSRSTELQVSTEQNSKLVDNLKNHLVPMIDGIRKVWKSDLATLKKKH